jgi:hypothetical protein
LAATDSLSILEDFPMRRLLTVVVFGFVSGFLIGCGQENKPAPRAEPLKKKERDAKKPLGIERNP